MFTALAYYSGTWFEPRTDVPNLLPDFVEGFAAEAGPQHLDAAKAGPHRGDLKAPGVSLQLTNDLVVGRILDRFTKSGFIPGISCGLAISFVFRKIARRHRRCE